MAVVQQLHSTLEITPAHLRRDDDMIRSDDLI